MEPLKFTTANNPKGDVLYVYPNCIVAVSDTIEPNRSTLHLEGGTYWVVEGSPQEVMLRIAQGS